MRIISRRFAALASVGCLAIALEAGPAVAAAAPAPAPTPTSSPTPPLPAPIPAGAPNVQATSYVVADLGTGRILAERSPHDRLRPASTLKILTALALLPKLDPNAVHVAVDSDIAILATAEPGASAVGVKPGLSYKVSDLWNGVFLRSGNDAVATLAAMAGGVPATLGLMRATAERLHAADTTVANADGYDADGQLSSAYDLALMARAGLADPVFRGYCSLQRARFPGDKGQTYEIDNENRLMGKYAGIIGVKNGYTSLAHHTFVGAAERNGRTIIVTVLDADTTIYQQTAKLLDWGFATDPAAPGVDQLAAAGGPDPGTPTATPAAGGSTTPSASTAGATPAHPTSVAAAKPSSGSSGGVLHTALVGLGLLLALAFAAVVALRARVLVLARGRERQRSAAAPSPKADTEPVAEPGTETDTEPDTEAVPSPGAETGIETGPGSGPDADADAEDDQPDSPRPAAAPDSPPDEADRT